MIPKKNVVLVNLFLMFYCFLQSSRTIDEHVPFRSTPSSVVSTEAENRNLVTNVYTAPLQPPVPLAFPPRNVQTTQPILPKTQSNSSEGARGITQVVPEKETWSVGDLKKQDRETIDECPICLEGILFYH